MNSIQRRNHHLMWRAGFGPAVEQLEQLKVASHLQLFKALQKSSSQKPQYIDAADTFLKGLAKGIQEEGMRRSDLEKLDRQKLQQENRQSIRSLNLMWLQQLVNSKAQLREKLSLFWHGHFATRNLNVFYQQQMLQVIREDALGSFRDLLHGVSKSAAMLNFLNANQNRKDHPNENFAREVMELFTLGRGHYTEADVKEAARAFTGWGANLQGDFVFRRFQHDNGSKKVLGKSVSTGEDVLNVLLDQKQTAVFISTKLYRFLVNENHIDQNIVQWLADRFYSSDYNISSLLEDIFTSDWFYHDENIGSKIKSPVELLVGIRRMLPMEFGREESNLIIERLLGQVLFNPPNVAGWPGGKSWIDSSSLMLRMRLPQLLSSADELNISPKADDDQMMGIEDMRQSRMPAVARLLKTTVEWTNLMKVYSTGQANDVIDSIAASVLQTKSSTPKTVVSQYVNNSTRDILIKSTIIQLMSTPEYQLC